MASKSPDSACSCSFSSTPAPAFNAPWRIRACATLEEVEEKMASQGGFAKTMWCGELACELKMKEEAGVSSRCIPLEQEHLGDTCACCGKPAKHMVYWGVAY